MRRICIILTKCFIILTLFTHCKKEEAKPTSDEIIDVDGNKYTSVVIGTQQWMVENLRVTHFRNGDSIPNITDNSEWGELTTGAYCNFNNDDRDVEVVGRLYNWYAVNDSRKIAPKGWHLPTDTEWQTLIEYLGGIGLAGAKLKEIGQTHWVFDNSNATNETGFTAVSSGFRYYMGIFNDKPGCDCANWWSSTEQSTEGAWIWEVYSASPEVIRWSGYKSCGFSVRCIKDK